MLSGTSKDIFYSLFFIFKNFNKIHNLQTLDISRILFHEKCIDVGQLAEAFLPSVAVSYSHADMVLV